LLCRAVLVLRQIQISRPSPPSLCPHSVCCGVWRCAGSICGSIRFFCFFLGVQDRQ
jgi:hypothetical protein